MCIGTPMQLVSRAGDSGFCTAGEAVEPIDLALVPDAVPGDHLLVFLGAARSVISAEFAGQVAEAHRALAAAAAGANTDFAFADLIDRPPSLPPHLEAARRAGRSFG